MTWAWPRTFADGATARRRDARTDVDTDGRQHMNTRRILQTLAAAACVVAAGHTVAQDAGFYLGAGLGQAQAKDACDTSGTTAVVSSCDDKDTAWRLFAGYQFNKYFALEGGYVDWGKSSFAGTLGATGFTGSAKAWGIDGSALGLLPLADWFALLGRVGATYWDLKVEGAIPSLGLAGSASDTGLSAHYGLGVQFLFAQHFGVRAEYTVYDSVGGDATGKTDIHMYGASVFYRF
jgi:OOP family OmpA-OmpF porin